MKISKIYTLLCPVIIFATALVSWNRSDNSTKELNTPPRTYLYDKNGQDLTEAEFAAYTADDNWHFSPDSRGKYAVCLLPAASVTNFCLIEPQIKRL